ncbi:MAG: hypothetical protein ACI4RD_07500 [Kiritimatiellia bacterium]
MKRLACLTAGLLNGLLLSAAPAAKTEPVAAGFPNWSGVVAKNYVCGRELWPSDLRHRITVVVDVEPGEKLQGQLALAGRFANLSGWVKAGESTNWDSFEPPRHPLTVVSVHGARDYESVLAALRYKGDDREVVSGLQALRSQGAAIYGDVTFAGAPDSAGKRPYYYVMGPTGTEPLVQGELTEAGVKAAIKQIRAEMAKLAKGAVAWRPFYGNVEDSKYHPLIAKALEKGKTAKQSPLAPVEKAILRDVTLKDEEQARTAQVLYDALNQTRTDLYARIVLESAQVPYRAYYDVQTLVKYWPMEKKRLDGIYAKFKNVPEVEALAKMFCKMMVWDDPEFTCKNAGEAKKIVQELNKMKKSFEKMKESKVIQVQNGALVLDMKADELISSVPSKLPVK